MELCTLSRTFVCCLALGALTAGCGGEDGPSDRTQPLRRSELTRPADSGTSSARACDLVRPREVGRLRASANDSTDLSICVWRGGGPPVKLVVDSAPRAQLRYYNQLAEQLQFHNSDPQRRPYQVKHVGDDDAYGGAGAWWTRTKSQLVAYADGRILRVRAPSRRAAVRLARLAFRRLSAPAP
jgi:hypothetical protein